MILEPYTYETLEKMGFSFIPLCEKNFDEFGIKEERFIEINDCDIILVRYTDPRAIGAVIQWISNSKKVTGSNTKERLIIDYDPNTPDQLIIRIPTETDTRKSNHVPLCLHT